MSPSNDNEIESDPALILRVRDILRDTDKNSECPLTKREIALLSSLVLGLINRK